MAPFKQAPEGGEEQTVAEAEIGVVARGRSVHIGKRIALPGEEVIFPVAEIIRLRNLGFLVDPDAEPIREGTGPRFERR